MARMEEKGEVITQTEISEVVKKIEEGIKEKESSGKKDKSVRVETKSGLFVKITRNPEKNTFYISISPQGGHPVYNKVIFDSSEKLKDFVRALEKFIKEREDVLIAIDHLNKNISKKSPDTI